MPANVSNLRQRDRMFSDNARSAGSALRHQYAVDSANIREDGQSGQVDDHDDELNRLEFDGDLLTVPPEYCLSMKELHAIYSRS